MGRMTAWSWPVITLPSMAIMMVAFFQLVKGIKDFTGYEVEDVVLVGLPPEKEDSESDEKPETEPQVAESDNA